MEDYNIKSLEQLTEAFKAIAAKLPGIAGDEVVNFTLENFKRQGFLGASFQPWRPRKNPTKWGKTPPRNNRAILVDTAKMRRATRVSEATWNLVKVTNNDVKAKVHNEGFRGLVHQVVDSYERKQTLAGSFGVGGIKAITGSHMSIKSRKDLKPKKVQTEVFVTGHNRKIKQNIPARPFLANSPYLENMISRKLAAEIMKAFKQ
jgi:hypothetical protein